MADTTLRGKIRLLHVDNEPDQLLFTRRLLEDADSDIHVESFSTPFEALDRLDDACDCILTDYQMPEMDGIEFARRAKKITDAPVILYTGRGSEEVASAAFAAGVNDYLRKEMDPGHFQVLARRIRHAVESRRTEHTLRESEQRYKILLDANMDAVYVIQDAKYVYVNKEAAKMLGYDDPAEILRREILDFYPSDEKERIRGYLQNAEGPAPTEYFTRLVRRDGSEVIVETKTAVIKYDDKPATLTVGRDVTARRRMEEALRRDEAEKTAILDTIPDGLSIIDRNYRYIWINEAEAARVKKTPAELIGRPCYTAFRDGSSPCDGCPVINVFQTGKPEAWTTQYPDGKTREIKANAVRDSAGLVSSVVVLSRDITDIQKSQSRTNALHTSTLKIDSSHTKEDVWRAVFEALTSVLGYKQTGIGLVEDDYLKFKARYRVHPSDQFLPLAGKSVTLRAIQTQRTQIVPDSLADPDYVSPTPVHPDNVFRSELAVPVIVDGEAIAVLNAESKVAGEFTEDDRKLIEVLALYASQAIKRIRQVNELRDSEEKYRRLAENAADVLFVVTLDGTITYTSREVNPHVGYTREEFIGENISKFIPPSETKRLMEMFSRVALGSGAWNPLILKVGKKGGGATALEFNPSPIFANGEVTGIQVVVRDVSSRVELERKLSALHVSAHRLSEAESLDQVWEIAVETLRSVLGFWRADVGVVMGDVVKFSHGLNEEHPGLTLPISGRGVTVRAIKTMQIQLVRDVSKDESYIPGIEVPLKHASELVVPIIADGKTAAVINLEEDRLDAFTEEDVHLAETLALHIASAVDRLWHVEAAQREKSRLAALHSSSLRLSAASTIDEVWRLVFEDLMGVIGFDVAGVGLVEENVLRFSEATSHMPAGAMDLPLDGRGVTIRAAKTRETQVVKNVREDPDYTFGPRVDDEDSVASEIAVPVVVDGETVAVLNVEVKDPAVIDEADARLMETLSLHAATAVSRLRQQEGERRYGRRLEVLNRHANALEKVESLQDALRLTYESLVSLGLRSPSISLLMGDVLSVQQIEGKTGIVPIRLSMDGRGITVRAAKTGKTQLVNDAESDPDLVPDPMELPIRSELVVPLKMGDRVIGVLNLESGRLNAYTEEDAWMVEMLAVHVSSTLTRISILDRLHREVEERTSALLAAEQMAAAGRVSAMVAHDLRGPLQTISNASHLIRQRPDKTGEMLGYINSAVERSMSMIEDLRLNTREEPLRLADTELPALVSQTIRELQPAGGVEFDVYMEDDLDRVSLDPLKIRRVLDNLFRNAAEAMPGGGRIRVNAWRASGGVVIEVSDTGKGIPPEVADRLFRPFATTKAGGLGLGLTYCRKAVEAHGGTISASSPPDGGAVFTIRLPSG